MSIPTKTENPKGLYQKYFLQKTNGEPIDDGAEYFVLRLDGGGSDPLHNEACRQAILTYATIIKTHLPNLSDDLFQRYGGGIMK